MPPGIEWEFPLKIIPLALKKTGMTNKFKKCHLIAIQEIAVLSTAMTHTYWTAPLLFVEVEGLL